MRKIKYRARTRLKNGKTKWVKGFYYEVFGSAYILPESKEREPSQIVDRETLGAFIQRTDKDGIDVYEGDILCFSEKDDDGTYWNEYFLVEYVDDEKEFELGYRCKSLNYESGINMFPQEDFTKHIAVIGNRYDNLRMLKRLEKRGRADE